MRYLAIGFCILSTACSSAPLTSPSAPTASSAGGAAAALQQTSAELPLKGSLQATETLDDSLHHLAGSGNATHLGRFAYSAAITIDPVTTDGVGTATWTAANGDQLFTSTAGTVVLEAFPSLSIREEQTITGGTGRFAGAVGRLTIERNLDLDTGQTKGTVTGTISLAH